MKPAHEANSMYGYRGARGEWMHVVWAIPLALTGVLIVVDSAWAESDIYGYVGANGVFELTNVPTDQRFRPGESQARRLSHRVSVEEVTEAVDRYAWQFYLHPALLLAIIKADSDFNPTAISRSGAVGLMQLIPETPSGTACGICTTQTTISAAGRDTCSLCWIALTGMCGWRWPHTMRANGG